MRFDSTIAAWSERQRLLFVERLLFWRGTINRKDLCDHFGISLPQATKDLVAYTTLNSSACHYDVRRKCYVASGSMEAVLSEPDFSGDMEVVGVSMRDSLGEGEFVLGMSRPPRFADVTIHRKLSLAASGYRSLEVTYWSVRSGKSEKRRISPRGFGYDGLRWHVRAYCHRDESFKDFVVGRFQSVGAARACDRVDVVDVDWLETEVLKFRANRELPEAKRKALEMDYGMVNGELVLPVRRAMRIYALRRLGFIQNSLEAGSLNELKQLEWLGTG